MEIKHLEKKCRKYVIATLSSPTMYLHKTLGEAKYTFIKDIEGATKTEKLKAAKWVQRNYYHDTHDYDMQTIILPLDVTYELIEEDN